MSDGHANCDSGASEEVPFNNNNNFEIAEKEEVLARKRWRPKGIKKNGNTSAAERKRRHEIEEIDEAEFFRERKRHTPLNMERGESSRAKKNEEGVGHGFDQELPFQKGINGEDMVPEEINEEEEVCNGDFREKAEATELVTGEIKKRPARRQQVFSDTDDFCDMIADLILGNRPDLETDEEDMLQAPPSQTESALPLKFQFEDEEPKKVEKAEHEKEIDALFNESAVLWAFAAMESNDYSEVRG